MRIERFESIRGLVALFVAVAHIGDVSSNLFSPLWEHAPVGVMVFFMLSGFVIHLSYQQTSDKSFKYYFTKRFNRIYIPLLLVFAYTAIFQFAQNGTLTNFSIKVLAGNLFMTQGILSTTLFNNGPLWSLSYEWWFYMLYIPILKIFRQKSSIIVYTLGIAACIAEQFYPASPLFTRFPIFLMVWWFGVDLANVYLNNNRKIDLQDIKYQLAALIIASVLLKGMIMVATILFILGFIWYKLRWRFFDKTIGLLHPFGSISYVIYISHWPLVNQAHYLDFIEIPYLASAIYMVTCILFSYIIERLVYPKLNKSILRQLFPAKYQKI